MSPGDFVDSRSPGDERVDTDRSPHRTAARRLERAFARHLDRDSFADCARVVVHDGPAGRYEYVDGVHYVADVADDVRERVEAFVHERDLEVVMDGHAGVAFGYDDPAAAADVHVAGAVVAAAFDLSFVDLTDVVEVLDATTRVSWTEPGPQTA
ncbi:hypothetical protein G9C85_03830 [Halorubellus sp. JP-L1]|uniref:hypothetical protein n=1 Tax=Halorubellus sp. JP-L1 TaxID=2715753 RepID=UPI0014095D3A|nr:hypothetical protein [Halorubellus sp. JP-L1]NHN40765.1 hypothetical protein [Halorubellus sp. JP-L1]